MKKRTPVCFAYFANNKFVGWYGGTMGPVSNIPKIYGYSEEQREVIVDTFRRKIEKINRTSFEVEKENVKGLAALSLIVFDGEELLRNKQVELRAVACPIYDGPNPDFDKEAYDKINDERDVIFKQLGIHNIPGQTKERVIAVQTFNKIYPRPECNNWIYANYEDIKSWAANEPTEFLEVIYP